MNNILVFNEKVIHEGSKSFVLIIPLQLFDLSELNIVDSLTYPFVPIHAVVRVELHAAKLHGQCFIVKDRISGKEVKVKRIDLEASIKDNEGNAQLHNLIRLSDIF